MHCVHLTYSAQSTYNVAMTCYIMEPQNLRERKCGDICELSARKASQVRDLACNSLVRANRNTCDMHHRRNRQ
eukprot:3316665-Amphidinium_carterae.1